MVADVSRSSSFQDSVGLVLFFWGRTGRKFWRHSVSNRAVARDDAALMRAAARGDREAFGVLVQRYQGPVVHFAQRFLGVSGQDAVEDLGQDVFLAAYKAVRSFRGEAKVLTWLLRITVNVCLNHRRQSRLRETLPLTPADAQDVSTDESARPDDRAIGQEEVAEVAAAVASLPANQRGAVLLRHFDGLSYAEIAEVLETSVPAVESLLFRARRTLAERIATDTQDSTQVSSHSGVQQLRIRK